MTEIDIMNKKNINKIIRTYFTSNFSEPTQMLFRQWFRANENIDEKEEVMCALWNEIDSSILHANSNDWDRIERKMYKTKTDRRKKVLRTFGYAAAAALIISFSVLGTYYFTSKKSEEYIQISVLYGDSKEVILSDGTQVAINAGSILIYPKKFTSKTRTVFLSGEANFTVAKNDKKPFIVCTNLINLKAIGTKFIVQSYPNLNYTKATLVEGKVKVDITDIQESYIMTPNQQLCYSALNHEVIITEVDAERLAKWEDGYMIFQNATLEEIAHSIERKYNVSINYDGNAAKKQSFYVKFNPKETLTEVLDVLCVVSQTLTYQIEGSTVNLYTNAKSR